MRSGEWLNRTFRRAQANSNRQRLMSQHSSNLANWEDLDPEELEFNLNLIADLDLEGEHQSWRPVHEQCARMRQRRKSFPSSDLRNTT